VNDLRKLDEAVRPLNVERYAALAQPGREALRRPLPEPRLRIDIGARDATLARHGLSPARPVAAFAPGAEYGPAKRWPARHFAKLAKDLAERGYQVWLFGSAKDAGVTAEIQELSGGICRDLAGKTSLDEAIDLMSVAARVVTNDSGLMHVAAALERPLVAIYGSSTPEFTPPLSAAAHILKLDMPCSPCFERTCPLGHFNCMMMLKPERVLALARERGDEMVR
jgi:heptosyltransferase-2